MINYNLVPDAIVSTLIYNHTQKSTQIKTWCSKDIVNDIRKISLHPDLKEDKWSWREASNGIPITKAIYRTLLHENPILAVALVGKSSGISKSLPKLRSLYENFSKKNYLHLIDWTRWRLLITNIVPYATKKINLLSICFTIVIILNMFGIITTIISTAKISIWIHGITECGSSPQMIDRYLYRP